MRLVIKIRNIPSSQAVPFHSGSASKDICRFSRSEALVKEVRVRENVDASIPMSFRYTKVMGTLANHQVSCGSLLKYMYACGSDQFICVDLGAGKVILIWRCSSLVGSL